MSLASSKVCVHQNYSYFVCSTQHISTLPFLLYSSFSLTLFHSGDTARASRTTDIEDPNQVLNVLVQTRPDSSSLNSDNSHSSKSANSLLSTGTRKSILIPEKSVKNIDAKSKRNSAHYYPDVDSEKFVRFGRYVKTEKKKAFFCLTCVVLTALGCDVVIQLRYIFTSSGIQVVINSRQCALLIYFYSPQDGNTHDFGAHFFHERF